MHSERQRRRGFDNKGWYIRVQAREGAKEEGKGRKKVENKVKEELFGI